MSIFPEDGRQVAHVLIDGVMARDPDGDLDTNSDATNVAWRRIADIEGAYTIDIDEGSDPLHVTLDLSAILGGALITIDHLVGELAKARGVSREEIAADVRAYLDL